MNNQTYKEIGKLEIDGVTYPVFFNTLDRKTYYLKDGHYCFVDWNWNR